jgi:phosphoribosyl 1,2-cyclic phosphate phosphodiesterase
MSFSVTILGCGSSGGVPRVGGDWGACDPDNPKNRRRRCSILVERHSPSGSSVVLVDTSPDLREQLLAQGTRHLDCVLLTHSHADHVHGIDDVRPLVINMKRRIDIHMDGFTSELVRRRFGYIFETPPGSQYPPLLNEHRLVPGHSVTLDGAGGPIEAMPFRLEHGDIDALGFRFGGMAYTPDVSAIPSESVRHLEDLDLWIIDALRYTRHPSHFSLEEALDWIARMKPRRAVLTNLHNDLDFNRLRGEVPANVSVAYDGLVLGF